MPNRREPSRRRYDYGLRGERDIPFPSPERPYRSNSRYDYGYLEEPDNSTFGRPRSVRPNRVVARYNVDYVFETDDPASFYNPYHHTGDREDRMISGDAYRRPYWTTGGTRTSRGVPRESETGYGMLNFPRRGRYNF